MGNKIFVGVVLLLWGSTMTWLLTAKILPPFFAGEPPVTKLADQFEPVAWQIYLNGKPCGTAVSQAVLGAGDCTEIHSLVRLEAIPLPNVAPKWMSGLLTQIGEIDLGVRSWTTLDSLGNLATFQTKIDLNESESLVRLNGVVDDGMLHLSLRSGNFVKQTKYPWAGDNHLSGELLPDSRLENLHIGKRWRREVYSMFGSPNAPISMVEAEVVDHESLYLDGVVTPMYRIEYRAAPTAGVAASDRTQAMVWVTEDGLVVRQEIAFLNARLRFTRLAEEEAETLAADTLELARYATTTAPPPARDEHASNDAARP